MASGIDFVNRYRFNLFFRTELNLVILQIIFSLTLLALIVFGSQYYYTKLSRELVEGVIAILQDPSAVPADAQFLTQEIEYEKNRAIVIGGTALLAITVIFGYLLARVMLGPTRTALASQKQFIGNIAHELRTPLAIIKTNMEVALLRDGGGDSRAMLRSNIEEIDRTSDIINNLLTFNALLQPERITFKNVSLGDVVDRAMLQFKVLADEKEIHMLTEKSGDGIVWGNAAALEQVVGNLLKNALSYTPTKGTVSLLIDDRPEFIELSVADTGIGIARDDLYRIFEPFYRVETSRARRGGGSGLGLAIVNDLVRLHHGRIAVRSVLKHGTTVVVSLPRGKEGERGAAPGPAASQISIDFTHNKKEPT